MRVDLHVHSKYSEKPSQWILKKIDCPESFTEPLRLYDIARHRGMTHVTITDHNCIAGALEIAHLPGTFISEEITAHFPEDGCKVHVLALDITEPLHDDIQKLRKNIYELAAYLRQNKIFHIVAHPLYAVNDKITLSHFERLLLLFQNFELNGARNSRENNILENLVRGLSPQHIEQLANQHDLAPLYTAPHRKGLFGGSDDHSSLNIARTYTEFLGDFGTEVSLSTESTYMVRVHSIPPVPQTMAHNLYGIAWQFFRDKYDLGRYSNKDALVRFLDRSLGVEHTASSKLLYKVYSFLSAQKQKRMQYPLSSSLGALLRHETCKIIREMPELLHTAEEEPGEVEIREQLWFTFVNQLSNRVIVHYGNNLLDQLSRANIFYIFNTIGSTGGLYSLLAPYFIAFSQFTKGRDLGRTITRSFSQHQEEKQEPETEECRVAHFTDTLYEVNGVALTLRQQVRCAAAADRRYTLITCDDQNRAATDGVKHFAPIGTYNLPEYGQQKLFYPPLLEMIDYIHKEGFNHIHTATPGPIGLAALAISRFLRLPISGTYHTAIPQYVQILTGSGFMEEMAWKFVIWYYNQMDMVYAPSRSTMDELIAKGINGDKIVIYPRGIDIRRFSPERRNGYYKKWNLSDQAAKLIYVGRVSKEKNLHLLSQAFRLLTQSTTGVTLSIVGDGPYFDEMKKETSDLPCVFTGRLEGEELAEIYASSDIFVFPSTTDTFGNVVLEAQASGIPVIVTDQGGPVENMLPDRTGLVVKGSCATSIFTAMSLLVNDVQRRLEMGKAARTYMATRSFDAAFDQTWELYSNANEQKQAMM